MSTIETILSRMMNEPAFAESLLTNPTGALADYDLSGDEVEKFKGLSHADFETFATASPEERKSLAGQISAGDLTMWRTHYGNSG